jgi:hypothetical protein
LKSRGKTGAIDRTAERQAASCRKGVCVRANAIPREGFTLRADLRFACPIIHRQTLFESPKGVEHAEFQEDFH